MNSKFIEANLKSILISIAGILLVCVAVGLVLEVRGAKEAKAQSALWEAKRNADQLITENKITEAADALSGIASKFSGTHAAFDASLSLGDIYAKQSKFSEAAQQYQLAVNNAPDKFSKMLATYNRGVAEEQGKQCELAIKSYEEAIRLAVGDFLNPELMMAEARCWEQLGDKAKASALYKDIHSKFANKTYYSNAAAVFEQRLAAEKVKN